MQKIWAAAYNAALVAPAQTFAQIEKSSHASSAGQDANIFLLEQYVMGKPVAYALQTVTWVPTSTTRPVGIWKKSVASLAERASAMNR